MQEIRNYLVRPVLENHVNHPFMMFRVSEPEICIFSLEIKMAESNFQREKQQFPTPTTLGLKVQVLFAYHRTPFIGHLCK